MEYKLNKVDPEVRQRVNEITKSGKVHSKDSVIVNNDDRKSKKDEQNFESELKKQKNKGKKLVVEAVITDSELHEASEDARLVGTILDIRK